MGVAGAEGGVVKNDQQSSLELTLSEGLVVHLVTSGSMVGDLVLMRQRQVLAASEPESARLQYVSRLGMVAPSFLRDTLEQAGSSAKEIAGVELAIRRRMSKASKRTKPRNGFRSGR